MSAYIIADIDVQDAARYETYKRLAQDAIARHGGRYLARGGNAEVFEGSWSPRRLVLIEFPDLAAAQRFYDSPEYGAARAARTGAATMNLVALEGL